MPDIRLLVVSFADSPGGKNQERGKLFEQLVADLVGAMGYKIHSKQLNISTAGMEIDVYANSEIDGTPLVAECKFYSSRLDAPSLVKFYGKYMAKWRKDPKTKGLFVAIPGLNSSALGFIDENVAHDDEISFNHLEEDAVIAKILEKQKVVDPSAFESRVAAHGTPGDLVLVFHRSGYCWIQLVASAGHSAPDAAAFFTGAGEPLAEDEAVKIAAEIDDLQGFALLHRGNMDLPDETSPSTNHAGVASETSEEIEDPDVAVVEVKCASSAFEYQLPSAPEYFVGRNQKLADADEFVQAVVAGSTSLRGMVFQGKSGWGKSSLAIAVAARLRPQGHTAIVIDCRTASGPRFVLDAFVYALRQLDASELGLSQEQLQITGYEGLEKVLRVVGEALAARSRALVVVFDQFENLFSVAGALQPILNTLLRLADAEVPVVVGFAWKTDFLGTMVDFPFAQRDSILDSSFRVDLSIFEEHEADAMLDELAAEIGSLRKDLRALLKEYAQGYPWLLKKLCAHVKAQVEAGKTQREISRSVLNVGELFQQDLDSLTPEAKDALFRIARLAPATVAELSEEDPAVLQSLVHRRLVVQVGTKFDIYWDIFRDFLTRGTIPVQENYILRSQVASVVRVLGLLRDGGGMLTADQIRNQTGLVEGSYWNLVKDMQLLGFVTLDDDGVRLTKLLPEDDDDLSFVLQEHLQAKLLCNRSVGRLVEALESSPSLGLADSVRILKEANSFVRASDNTWKQYVRILGPWMEISGLASYSTRQAQLTRLGDDELAPNTALLRPRRGRGELAMPEVQYAAIEEVACRIDAALASQTSVDWTGISDSSRRKALSALERFGWIVFVDGKLRVRGVLRSFAQNEEARQELFRSAAMGRQPFAEFVSILAQYQETGASLATLGGELATRLGAEWTDQTCKWIAKVCLDWARAAGLAGGVFQEARRGGYRPDGVD